MVVGSVCHAQYPTPLPSATPAPTPTTHPDALEPGLYHFELLDSPYIQVSGTHWSVTDFRYMTGLENDTNGESLSFWTSPNAYYIVVKQRINDSSSNDGTFEVCVYTYYSDCVDRGSWYRDSDTFVIELGGSLWNTQVTFTKTNNQVNSFDYMEIFPNSLRETLPPFSGEIAPYDTPTPDPAYIYGSISGVSGTISTRFDMVVTAGDVAVTNSLLFLFFSFWAIVFIIVVVRVRDV